jgi:hypothetical protein
MGITTSVRELLNLAIGDFALGLPRRRSLRRGRTAVESLELRSMLSAITVNSAADNLTADSLMTLREAIIQANENAGADSIIFGDGSGLGGTNFTDEVTDTIMLSLGELKISETVTISGLSATRLVISGNNASRVFSITSGDTTLEKLTLTGGKTIAITSHGGAILFTSRGQLTVNQCTFTGNSTSGYGSRGGAISMESGGSVTVSQSTLSGNSTSGNRAKGGAIFSDFGAVTVRQSTLSGNFTTGEDSLGGAIYCEGDIVTVSQSRLTGNHTSGPLSHGGAIYVRNNSVLTVSQSTLSGNSTAGFSARGGAIHSNFGAVTVSQSTFSGNSTTGDYGLGGAITSVQKGKVTITNSTLSGNQVNGKVVSHGGGALWSNHGEVTIVNSTITENSADIGGGLDIHGINAERPVTIRNSIIADNIATTGPDFFTNASENPGANTTVQNCLFGNNSGASTLLPATAGSTPNANGNFIGSGTSPIDPHLGPLQNNGGPTQTHELLGGSLALNHGNNALIPVDVLDLDGDLNTAEPVPFDQRGAGFARIGVGTVDMGAYERLTLTDPIVVSTNIDELDGDVSAGDVSLREAIDLANSSPGPNTITFATSTNGTEFDLSLGQMEIGETVTITGNGAFNSLIDAQQLSRIFDITGAAGDVTLNELTLKNGRTTDNGSTFGGGAIRTMSSGTLVINRSRISGNSTIGSDANGGAIFTNSGKVLIGACTITGNFVDGYNANGGAVYTASGMVVVSQTILSQNAAAGTLGNGGAICSQSGNVMLNQSTFNENSTAGAESRGGAVATISGDLTVSQSTFSHNMTAGFSGDGGAIFSFSGSVTISQSTLSGNSTTGDEAQGGAVHVYNGPLNISQSTVADNHTTKSTAGGIFSYAAPITIKNSIIAGNSDFGAAPDLRPSPADTLTISNSLIGRTTGTGLASTSGTTPDAQGNFIGGNSDSTKIDPKLGPLANNGGPTQTHALLTGSLAIDRGSNANAVDVTNGNTALMRDQRGVGFTRILDGDSVGSAPAAVVDMGAVEFSGLRLTSPGTAYVLRPTLTWTAIAGATSYNIWINNESTGQARYYLSTSTAASQTVTSDFAIGKYRVQIQPVFGAVIGNWNPPTSIFVLPPVVLATMPKVQLVSRPAILWNALPGAVKYDLWIDNVTTGQTQFVRQDVTGTSFTPSADLPMGIYRVWVRAVDKIGNFGAWSARYDAQVLPGAIPVGPLSATFDRTPTFSWQPVTGAIRYEVYVRNSSAINVYNGQSTTATNWTPTVNLPDGQYRWWVVAVNAANYKSGGATITDLFVGGRPTIVAPVAGSSSSIRTPIFTWKAVDGAATYVLQVNRIDVATGKIIFRTGLTGTSFTATAALPAGTYRAWVQAVSTSGSSSPFSLEVNFTITSAAPTLDLLDDEWLLTGLLVSDVSRDDSEDVQQAPPPTAVDDRDHEDAAIDQCMVQIYGDHSASGRASAPTVFDLSFQAEN